MANWYPLRPAQLVPPGITQITTTFSTLSSTITTALQIARTTLEIAQALAESAGTSAVEDAIASVISELQGFLNGLAGNTTAHGIFIPIQKQPFGLGVEPRLEDVPGEDRLLNYAGFAENNGIAEDDEHPETLVNFIDTSSTAVGGNRGFWKKLRLSLDDTGDEARPMFPDTFAVVGTVIVFGANNVRELLKQARIFQGLIRHNPRDVLTGKIEPVAEDLRARTVADPESGEIGVILQWEPVTTIQNPGLFSEEQLIVDELLIIRSQNPEFREKMTWDEVFSSQPSDDQSVLLTEGDYQVVARFSNDGFIRKHVDLVELEENVTYYYAVACRYTLDEERQPIGSLSGVIRVNYQRRPMDSRQSEAPDWFATPSLIEMFPVLESLVSRLDIALEQLSARTVSLGGPAGAIQQAIDQLTNQIDRIDELNAQLSAINNQLNAFLTEDPGGIYTTIVTVSDGGIDKWMAEVARALSDTSDPDRPPFDNAELVGGVVLLAGAPGLPALSGFQTLLELFFGNSGNNPLLNAVNSVERAVATVEARTFDERLRSVATATIPATDIEPSVVFDSRMVPIPSTVCD